MTSERFVWIAWGFVAAAIAVLLTFGVRSAGWVVPIFLIVAGLVGMILAVGVARRLRASWPLHMVTGFMGAALGLALPLAFFVTIDTDHPERTIWGRGWYQNIFGSRSEYVVTAKRIHPDDEDLGCVSYRISPDEESETCFRLQEDLAGYADNEPIPTDFLSCHGWSRGVYLGSVVRRRSTYDAINVGDSLPDCWRQGIAAAP
ncbi:MAG: hypothetical protein OXG43_06215 [Chloroflexi bacterium]|nr:hypothetical protein [Chloroflexota bacterium]